MNREVTPESLQPQILRYVSRAMIVDSNHLDGSPLPPGPVLAIQVDEPMRDASFHLCTMRINGCDILCFEAHTESTIFCNLASAADPWMLYAVRFWNRTGVAPIWMQHPDQSNEFALQPFSISSDFESVLSEASSEDYLNQFHVRVFALLQPNGIEEAVAGREWHPFKFNEAYEKAFADSNRKEFLSEFRTRFNEILEPGVVEAVVAGRTGQVFDHVQVGFLATVHTQPALDPLQ